VLDVRGGPAAERFKIIEKRITVSIIPPQRMRGENRGSVGDGIPTSFLSLDSYTTWSLYVNQRAIISTQYRTNFEPFVGTFVNHALEKF
jgi:hypothetical protein